MTTIRVPDRGGDTFICAELEDGYRAPFFFNDDEKIKDIWRKMPDLPCREDDVLLCSFPKTGTNWLYEILAMILAQKPERIKENKVLTMIEAVQPEPMANLPSPRILNTHVHYRYLPKEIKKKKVKTVLIVRNPKDTAVSYFNHVFNIKMYQYSGKWENFLPMYVAGDGEYSTYESYLQEFEKAIKAAEHPIYLVYYENLKKNGVEEIRRLASFLGVEVDEELSEKIENMCSFDQMKKDKFTGEYQKRVMKENKDFLRKGQVGDWKNWFTVAQNDMFDQIWEERMKDCKLFQFNYE